MIELKAQTIKNKTIEICEYFEGINSKYEFSYRDGYDKEKVINEIKNIQQSINQNDPVTLAFVGEYNAGKTSIINLLTNNDYLVSSNVGTLTATKTQWNDYIIIDTPGMGSGRPEHDEETKKWLAEADLLIYILTTDLLTNFSGERFSKIIKNFNRNQELMLVTNMIDQEGNDIEVYKEELQSFIEPIPLSEFYPTFISAEYMYKSIQQVDAEDKSYYRKESNFDIFIETLNVFLMNKKQKAILSTPLTRIYSLSQTFEIKSEFDKEIELLNHKIQLFNETEKSLIQLNNNFSLDLKSCVSQTSGDVFRSLDNPPKDFKEYIENEFKQFSETVSSKVEILINDSTTLLSEFEKENSEIDNSELAKEITAKIKKSEKLRNIFENISKTKFTNQNNKTSYYDEFLNQAKNINNKFGGENMTSNSKILNSSNFLELSTKLLSKIDTKTITTTMRSLGYKFARGQAVKLRSTISKKIIKSTPILNIAGVAWDIGLHFYNKNQDEKQETKLREFKESLKESLNGVILEAIKMTDTDLINPITNDLLTLKLLYNTKKQEILEFSETNKELVSEIESKREYCLSLHEAIYN
jgi:ethanolamine utilization protein EutP (predicted NTPase)